MPTTLNYRITSDYEENIEVLLYDEFTKELYFNVNFDERQYNIEH